MTKRLKMTFAASIFSALFLLAAVPSFAVKDEFKDPAVDASRGQNRNNSYQTFPADDGVRPLAPGVEEKRAELMQRAEERRAEREEEAEERRTEIQARMQEKQEKRVEFQRESAERRVENAKRVISATIERLFSIAERVESRIEKVSATGGETTEAETYLAAARADLEAAKASVEELDDLDLSSDSAQMNFELIRVTAQEAKEHIRSAHKNLAESVSSFSQDDIDESDSSDDTEEVVN